MTAVHVTGPEYFKNKAGEEFILNLVRIKLPDQYSYWLYQVQAEHKTWGFLEITVCVEKKSYTEINLAEYLVKTIGMGEAKYKLENAKNTGRPLNFPIINSGYCVF